MSDLPPPINQKEGDKNPELETIEQAQEKKGEQEEKFCPDEKDKGHSVPELDLPIPNQKVKKNETIYAHP